VSGLRTRWLGFRPRQGQTGPKAPLPSRDKAAATWMPCSLTFLHTLVHCKMGLSYCTLSTVARNSDLRLYDPTRITGERFATPALFSPPFPTSVDHEGNVCTYRSVLIMLITYSLFVSSLPLKEQHKCFSFHLNTFKTVLVIWSAPLKDNSETTSPHHQATLPTSVPIIWQALPCTVDDVNPKWFYCVLGEILSVY